MNYTELFGASLTKDGASFVVINTLCWPPNSLTSIRIEVSTEHPRVTRFQKKNKAWKDINSKLNTSKFN